MTDIGELRFLERFHELLYYGSKITTIRRTQHGHVGDIFHAFGMVFEIGAVHETSLAAAVMYEEMGTGAREQQRGGSIVYIRGLTPTSPALASRFYTDAWNDWKECYPDTPPDPNRIVFLHEFRRRIDLEPKVGVPQVGKPVPPRGKP
jgi:hypothetical protein